MLDECEEKACLPKPWTMTKKDHGRIVVATSSSRKSVAGSAGSSTRVRDSFKLWSQTARVGERERGKSKLFPEVPDRLCGVVDDAEVQSDCEATPENDGIGHSSSGEFECMTIQVSIISLSGLLVQRRGVSKRRRRRKRSSAKPIMDSSSIRAMVGANVTCSNEGPWFRSFIPSHELEQLKSANQDGTVPFTAYWGEDCSEENGEESRLWSTMQMTREMKRIGFKRNIDLGRVAHFENEHIDLQIAVGYGTEMIVLGQASIAVSGEEESLNCSSIPVRSTCEPGRKRQLRESSNFASDSGLSFSLAANATLQIGVRVVPSSVLPYKPPVHSNLLQQPVIETLEFADDDSLLSSFISDQGSYKPSISEIMNFVGGCSALPLCMAEGAGNRTPSNTFSSSGRSKEVTEAEVTPLHLLSDVSESTIGSTDEEASYE